MSSPAGGGVGLKGIGLAYAVATGSLEAKQPSAVASSPTWDGVIDRLARQMRVDGAERNDHVHYGGQKTTAALYAKLDIASRAHLLDLCSGQGGPARFLAKRDPTLSITCVELNARNVDLAKQQNAKAGLARRVRTLEGSAHDLSALTSRSVDAALALDADAFAYVDRHALCRELARVMKPGARLALQHWVLARAAAPSLAEAFDKFCTWGGETPVGVNSDSYVKALEDAGFTVEVTDARERYAREQVRQIANLCADRADAFAARRQRVPSEADLWQEFSEGRARGMLPASIAEMRSIDGLDWAIGLLEFAARHGIGVELVATRE